MALSWLQVADCASAAPAPQVSPASVINGGRAICRKILARKKIVNVLGNPRLLPNPKIARMRPVARRD
jgi:hypothetical protein